MYGPNIKTKNKRLTFSVQRILLVEGVLVIVSLGECY